MALNGRARMDDLKKSGKLWTTAMLALALSKLSDEEYWVEIETFERTPDTRLHYINQSSGHNVIQTRNIENVDWEENVDDIMEVIGKKCRRAYPGDYLLVVSRTPCRKSIQLGSSHRGDGKDALTISRSLGSRGHWRRSSESGPRGTRTPCNRFEAFNRIPKSRANVFALT
jgi:hypothetical protein